MTAFHPVQPSGSASADVGFRDPAPLGRMTIVGAKRPQDGYSDVTPSHPPGVRLAGAPDWQVPEGPDRPPVRVVSDPEGSPPPVQMSANSEARIGHLSGHQPTTGEIDLTTSSARWGNIVSTSGSSWTISAMTVMSDLRYS